MAQRFRQTQPGWVILGSTVPIGVLLLGVAVASGQYLLIGTIALLILGTAALFGSLTVSVGDEAVEARFGVGLIRKSVPLSEVRSVAPVTNPWYYGWGLRAYPGGVLYNVSGPYAVELRLRDGSQCRIGTADPEGLAAAILAATGPLDAPAAGGFVRDEAQGRRWGLLVGGAVGALVLGLGGLLAVQSRPPVVAVSGGDLVIDVLFYGERIPLSEVRSVSLEERLPPVLMRTNGFAMGESLRGWFRFQGLGDGKLFVEARHPPYVMVRHAGGVLFVNRPDPAETRAIFEKLAPLVGQGR